MVRHVAQHTWRSMNESFILISPWFIDHFRKYILYFACNQARICIHKIMLFIQARDVLHGQEISQKETLSGISKSIVAIEITG